MIKIAKRGPRLALTVLAPCGNAFSVQKPIWGNSWIEKTQTLAKNAQKWDFWPFWTKISKFKVDALPHGWAYRPGRWLKMTIGTYSTK